MEIRKSLTLVLAAALIGLTTACQPAGQEGGMQETAAVDTAAIMASLDSLRSSFEEDFAAGDAGAMAGQFTQDAVYAEPGGPPVTGRSPIESAMEANLPPEGATITIEPTRTRIVSADWVWEMGVSTASFTPEGADEPQETSSNYLVIVHRTSEGWKLAAEALAPHQLPGSSEM